jgi:TonB family protein
MPNPVKLPRPAAICLALSLFLPAIVRSQQTPDQSPPSSAASSPVSYPDSAGGLEHFGKDLLSALKSNDSARAMTLAQSMALPDSAAWYHQTYGDFTGDEDARAYEYDRPQLASKILGLFKKAIAEGNTGIHVKRYDGGCDDNDGENTYPLLEYRVHKTPLYDLRLFNGESYFRLWPLAYVDGTFRYVGDPEPWQHFPPRAGARNSPSSPPESPAQDKEDREVAQIMQGGAQVSQTGTGGTYAVPKLINQVKPIYPDRAIGEHVQGRINIRAIIGKDGTIKDLRVTKGYCSLAPAAVTAVRQWRYSPPILQGKPIELQTTLDVYFQLNSR